MASNYVDKDRLRQKKILIIVCSVAAILILVYICARAACMPQTQAQTGPRSRT